MTAASPPCSPASSHSSSICFSTCYKHLRKGEALQNKLRLDSPPGVWLLLGGMMVLLGMSVAVAGYVSAPPKPAVGERRDTHADRMKLAGPVVMGVGLFIFICAASLLFENRDKENPPCDSSDDMEDLRKSSSREDTQEQWENTDEEQLEWASPVHQLPHLTQSPLLPRPNSPNSLPAPPDAGGKDIEGEIKEEEEKKGKKILLTIVTKALHHQEPVPHPSSPCLSDSYDSVHLDSCNSCEINLNERTVSELPKD
ncbi:transmembrane protein 200B-like [Cyprinodon tularosa]|uniref:transmembrane protein 200B-like n=1 Tax=Cyprinodon tularosa TaxID=77115 RepID=UPI0018E1FB80|nr:transmembrane protein 200B-like [Cyprinodon tularosa]